jgi:mRNA-degrading endonuclease YafQ of YafQ-DinJ toxin-antitoxin module
MESAWTMKDIVQTIAAVFQGLGSFSIVVGILIYRHQRKTALESEARQRSLALQSERQANRSRLTEAYMNVHAYILHSQENIKLIEELLRRGHDYVELRNGEMTRAIELIYLKLNAFYLEWNYRNTYDQDLNEFYKTFDHAMRGFATTTDKNFEKIVEHFADIFSDFPNKFLEDIVGRLNSLRDRPVKPELNLIYLGDTNDAVDWFCQHANNIESVDNTIFYRYTDERRQVYTAEAMPRYVDTIKMNLRNRCIWTDLFTNDQRDAAEEFFVSLSDDQRMYYRSRVIKSDLSKTPLLQVLILRYRHDRKAVLFGWGFPNGKETNVYLSTGKETVEYFEDYFDSLMVDSEAVHSLPYGALFRSKRDM